MGEIFHILEIPATNFHSDTECQQSLNNEADNSKAKGIIRPTCKKAHRWERPLFQEQRHPRLGPHPIRCCELCTHCLISSSRTGQAWRTGSADESGSFFATNDYKKSYKMITGKGNFICQPSLPPTIVISIPALLPKPVQKCWIRNWTA